MKLFLVIIKRIVATGLLILFIGLILPHPTHMPVKGASAADYHPDSFWFYPWGKSVVHKGVDIFQKKGTDVEAATYGLVVFQGVFSRGGNVVLILGPKWRMHYYAHLDRTDVSQLQIVKTGTKIGSVGNTGNAQGKPAHLHYTIYSLIPLPWRVDESPQGYKKAHFLNPIDYIAKN